MSIAIRPAIESDAVALHDYTAALTAEQLPSLYRKSEVPTVEEQLARIRRFADRPRSLLLVAASEGVLCAMLDFHPNQTRERAHSGAFGMSVAQSHRRQGLGSALLRHLCDWAPAQAIHRLELEVFSNNSAAIALYQRNGFIPEGRLVRAVQMDDGYIDILVMAKLLAQP